MSLRHIITMNVCHLHNENVCVFKEGHLVIYRYQKTFIIKNKKDS